MVYYNENEPFCVDWLKNLIAEGHIAKGIVDGRDIRDVAPNDLKGFTQCHFFAGIGVWSLALRMAGWPDTRPVWTGSCPCQPFSQAGGRKGFLDERHLWPAWYHLLRVARPHQVFGEQVASVDGREWLAVVSSDLEGIGYAVGSVEFPACGVGAYHLRQRLWFVAKSHYNGCDGIDVLPVRREAKSNLTEITGRRAARRMGNARLDGDRKHARKLLGDEAEYDFRQPPSDNASLVASAARDVANADGGLGDERRSKLLRRHHRGDAKERRGLGGDERAIELGNADLSGLEEWKGERPYDGQGRPSAERASKVARGNANRTHTRVLPDLWENPDWVYCRDGKLRPIEPGTLPLADGTPARVGRLRAYGNAISPQAAAQIIKAGM